MSVEPTTPNRHTCQGGTLTRKSAMASLRQNLSRHSRNSGRGSVSNVFRRNGSNASSPRGPRDPEAIVRESQDLSNTASQLSKDESISKDAAAWVPLPSSPINIPPPPYTLRLDLGPPAMLSPFKPTESDLAEIKPLQDPENITTGVPLDCPLDWHSPGHLRRSMAMTGRPLPTMEENVRPDKQHHREPIPAATNEHDDVFGPDLPAATPSKQFSLTKLHESIKQNFKSSLTAEDYRDVVHVMDRLRLPASETASKSTDCHRQPGHYSPVTMLNDIQNCSKRRSSECTDSMTLSAAGVSHAMPSATDTAGANAPNEIVPVSPDTNKSLDEFSLPSPQPQMTERQAELIVPAVLNLVDKLTDERRARIDADKISAQEKCRNSLAELNVISAQEKYRDSLAELEGCLAFEELDPDIVQHVEQNPFVGGPGTPGNALHRSDSVKTISCSGKSDRDFAMPQIQDKTTEMVANQELNPAHGSTESQIPTKARQDSLFNDPDQNIVFANGPPSPERSVKLPLRPKATTTEQTSFESTIFKPILDRVVANNLNIFRPGSDPVLRQKYFPHASVAENASVDRQREMSLDSDDAVPDNTHSSAAVGVFERAIEQPSPLHIRKQSNTQLTDTDPLIKRSVSPSEASAPDSSPTRTPSMGDRQQFDRQRAERNARYSAIYSGEHGIMADLDAALQLAEFGNAGPVFRGSTPKRDGDGERDSCELPMSSERGPDETHGAKSASLLEENKPSSTVSRD